MPVPYLSTQVNGGINSAHLKELIHFYSCPVYCLSTYVDESEVLVLSVFGFIATATQEYDFTYCLLVFSSASNYNDEPTKSFEP